MSLVSQISALATAVGQQLKATNTAVAGKLTKASNLSDLPSAATARTNLGLGSAATHAASEFSTGYKSAFFSGGM